ncbi:filamentous hemagglutinin N-terminal domain-containing protein [Microbulbifer sp. ARAS458-1]|uniref:filamentous hemagglutinin N-terminal domain-containing protein n=1 Tax=Microbulbifer sp. ARAS458-1 TaxID=3140242 RepID=UPI003877D8D4
MKRNLLSVAVSLAGLMSATVAHSVEVGNIGDFTTDDAVTFDDSDKHQVDDESFSKISIDGKFAKLDWETFNIAQSEGLYFDFTAVADGSFDASSVVINKVQNGTTSIAGWLGSDGHVVLINPRGVLFGQGASVNVAALTAAAMEGDIDSGSGDFAFNLIDPSSISSEDGESRSVTVEAGSVIRAGRGITLIGESVKNSGLLSTAQDQGELVGGNINIHTGGRVTLSLGGDGLIGVEVEKEALDDEFDAAYEILNSGTVDAVQVVMKAGAADGIYSAAVNNTGIVQATGIETSGGKITLGAFAGDSISASVSNKTGDTAEEVGKLQVSNGTVEKANAGTIDIVAKTIELGDGSALLADAKAITDPGTGDAIAVNGGDITVAATESLAVDGTINASGSDSGSTGGTVKTTSESTISIASTTSVDTVSDDGLSQGGEWLIEASSVTLDTSASSVVGTALENNKSVTVATFFGALNVDGSVGWSSDSSLNLVSEDIVGLATAQTVTASNGTLNVIAASGFTNNAAVSVNDFSLEVGAFGAEELDSPTVSVLGNIQSVNPFTITNSGGNHYFNVSTISSFSEIESSGGVTSLKSDSASVATITNADGVVVGAGVTLFGNNGTDGIDDDVFFLNGSGNIEYSGVIFENLDTVDGLGGKDAINASTFSGGIGLTDTTGQLDAGGLVITGITEITTETLTGTTGQEVFDLAAGNTLTVDTYDGFNFLGVAKLNGNGGSDRFNSTAGGDWVLAENLASVTHDHEVDSDLNIVGVETFTGGSGNVIGDGNSYFFDVDSGTSVTVANNAEFDGTQLIFSGISKVESNGELNALDLSEVYLKKDDGDVAADVFVDTASDDGGIKFIGLSGVEVAQIDTRQAGGIALSVTGNGVAEFTDIKLEASSLTGVIGASGNKLYSTGDWTVIDDGANNNGIDFTGIWEVESGGADLTAGKDIENNFSISSDGYVGIHGMLFKDLAKVSPGAGSSSSHLSASDYEYGVVIRAESDSVALLTDAAASTGTVFYGLSTVTTDVLSARNAVGTAIFTIKNGGSKGDYFDVSTSNIEFYALKTVQGTENGTEVIGWDDSWTLNRSEQGELFFSSGSGVDVYDFDTINTDRGTLDFNIGERFTLESDGDVVVANTTFSDLAFLQRGSGFVVGTAGNPSLDASAYSNGLVLTDTELEVVAGTLEISDISSITANKLTASTTAETQHDFVIGSSAGSQTVTVNKMDFSALQEVISDGNDSFSEKASGLAVLYLDDASGSGIYSHLAGAEDEPDFSVSSGILFSDFASTSVASVNTNGQSVSLDINSSNNADLASDAFTFTGLSTIAGSGNDQVTGGGTWILGGDHVGNSLIDFTGAWDVDASGGQLKGSTAQEVFTLQSDGTLTVSGYTGFEFSDLTSVTKGASSDSVSSASGINWALLDADSVESSNGITFDGFENFNTTAATLTGTTGDDAFTLTGSADDGATVSYENMAFTGLVGVVGNGSTYDAVSNPGVAGDQLDASGYSDALALTGTDGELQVAGTLTFKGLNSAILDQLTATDSADVFEASGSGALTAAAINLSGLSRVNGGGGNDKLVAQDTPTMEDGYVRSSGIDFYDLGVIDANETATLNATNNNDVIVFDDLGKLTINGIAIENVTTIDARGGTDDRVTGMSGQDWQLLSGTSAKNNGITFLNAETLAAVSGGLLGTTGADRFTLNTDDSIDFGSMTISGMTSLNGNGDADRLDASAFGAGISLTTTGELEAGELTITGITDITTGKLTGTTGKEVFDLATGNILTVDTYTGFIFRGVANLDGNGGSDSFNSAAGGDWVLAENLASVTLDRESDSDLTITGVDVFTGGAGVIKGHSSGHDFVVTADSAVTVDGTHQFSGISSVDAGTGADDVEAIAGVTLAGTDGAFKSSAIDFTGIDSATASALQGSTNAEVYTLQGSGAVEVADIDFTGVSSVDAGTGVDQGDRVDSRGGQGFTLNADNSVLHDGITFSNVEHFTAPNDANLNASAFGAGLVLTGSAREVTAGSITFSGLTSANTASLTGSTQSDVFTLTSDSITARLIEFDGVTSVTAGGTGNSVDSASGINWALLDADSVESSNGITFDGFESINSTAATLTGTTGDDAFTLTGSADDGATVSYENMAFTGLVGVVGNGSTYDAVSNPGVAGDQLDASGYSDALALTGTDGELQVAGTLTFKGLNSAILDQLTATDSADVFEASGSGALTAAAINLSGLSRVNGGGGNDKLVAQDTPTMEDGYVRSSGIDFYDLGVIDANETATLNATNNNDIIAFDDLGKLTVNGIAIENVTTIDARGGTDDRVTGMSGQDWQLLSGTSAKNNGITFLNAETLAAVSGGLLGTTGADRFTLNTDDSIDFGSMTISGMTSLNGNGDADRLDASAFGAGISLTTTTGELKAGELTITGITDITTGKLTGTTDKEVFDLATGNILTVDTYTGFIFRGVANLDGNGGSDSFNSTAGGDWQLAENLASVTLDRESDSDLTIAGVEVFTGGAGVIKGHSSGHDFVVTADSAVTVDGTHQFSGISSVDAGTGADDVEAIAGVTLAGTDGAFKSSAIDFTGIDSATASALQGSTNAEVYTLQGSGAVEVADIDFTGVSSVDAGTGVDQGDRVDSRGGQGFTLNADNSVLHDGITFSNVEHFTAPNDANLNASAFGAGLVLTGSAREVTAGSITFSGLTSANTASLTGSTQSDVFTLTSDSITARLIEFDGVTSVTAGGTGNSVDSASGINWALLDADSVESSNGITFDGFENFNTIAATLSGTTGDDAFTLTGSADDGATVSYENMAFTGLVGVVGNGSTYDAVSNPGVAGDQLDASGYSDALALTGTDGELQVAGTLTFAALNSAVLAELDGSAGDETFEVTGAGAITVADLNLTGLNRVNGNDGTNTLRSAGTIDLNETNDFVFAEGIEFYDIKQLDVGAVGATDDSDEIWFNADGNVIVNGFEIVSESTQIDGKGGVDTVTGFDGADWTIVGGSSAENNGITFLNVEILNALSGGVFGTDGVDAFVLNSADSISVGGLTINDMTFVDGVSADNSLDASAYNGGLTLSDTAGEVFAGSLSLKGIKQATTDTLTGSAGADSFALASDGSIEVAGIAFQGVTKLAGGAEGDSLSSSIGADWQLAEEVASLQHGDLLISGIERFAGGSGRIVGNDSGHTFAVIDNGALTVDGIQFSNVTAVDGGIGSDDVTAISSVQLAGVDGAFTSSEMAFTGIESVSASELVGSATTERFVLSDGGITVAGMGFSGVESVDAGGGTDVVTGDDVLWRSLERDAALVEGAAVATVDSLTVLFENLEQVEATGAYTGPSFGADYFMTGPQNLQMGGVNFAGVDSITAGSGSDTLHGFDADMSWTLGASGGSVSDAQASVSFSGFEQIVAGGGNDAFQLDGGSLVSLDTGAGDDTVVMGGTLLDNLLLGAGDDVLQIMAGSQPTQLAGGSGSDQLVMQLAAQQQWQIRGNSDAQHLVGDFVFTGFESLQDTAGGLNLVSSQQMDFTNVSGAAGIEFNGGDMALEYGAAGDVVLVSSTTETIGGFLKAGGADLTLAGDLDIESDLESLSLRSSGGDIDVSIVESDDLVIGKLDVGRGNLSLASANFGLLTAESFRDTHITAGTAVIGTEQQRWGNIGTVINPLRFNVTESVDIVALFYYEPAFEGHMPLFTAIGNKGVSIASTETTQGLKSAVQNPVDDIAQLDPGIFSEVAPYSLGIDVLNLPEVRLHGGELQPLDGSDDDEEEREESAQVTGGAVLESAMLEPLPVAVGGR